MFFFYVGQYFEFSTDNENHEQEKALQVIRHYLNTKFYYKIAKFCKQSN